nr:hypothetical protein [Vineibacter terrae]
MSELAEEPGEIGLGVDGVELAGLNERHKDDPGLGAAVAAGEEMMPNASLRTGIIGNQTGLSQGGLTTALTNNPLYRESKASLHIDRVRRAIRRGEREAGIVRDPKTGRAKIEGEKGGATLDGKVWHQHPPAFATSPPGSTSACYSRRTFSRERTYEPENHHHHHHHAGAVGQAWFKEIARKLSRRRSSQVRSDQRAQT